MCGHGTVLVEPPVGERSVVALVPIAYAYLPPRNVISATGARTTRGPTSRYFAGRRLVNTSGGSTTWSSAETIRGIVVTGGTAPPSRRGATTSVEWLAARAARAARRRSRGTPRHSRNMRGGTCSRPSPRAAHSPKNVVNSDDTPSACAASIMFWHAGNRLDAAPAGDLAASRAACRRDSPRTRPSCGSPRSGFQNTNTIAATRSMFSIAA